MSTLGLERLPGRCSGCGFHVATQGCRCSPVALRDQGITATTTAADPDERGRIDAAITRLAATGREFSANDARVEFPGVSGSIVGARFNAAARRGLIRDTGKRVASTLASTHAHEVRVWIGAA